MPLLGSIDAIRRASRVNDVVCSVSQEPTPHFGCTWTRGATRSDWGMVSVAPLDSAKVVTVEGKGNQAAERRVAAIRYSYFGSCARWG
jgi:hypothetical protein